MQNKNTVADWNNDIKLFQKAFWENTVNLAGSIDIKQART